MKQVRRFVDVYDVTTCAPGGSPDPGVEHVSIDPEWSRPRSRIGQFLDDVAREREWFSWTYAQVPAVRQIKELLRGHRFDAVIANDMETLGAAREVVPWARIHADLHEFWPGMPTPPTALGERQRRYREWMTAAHGPRAASSSTVGPEIADRYRQYGLDPAIVTNSPRYRDLSVTPTHTPIRLVHSGYPFLDRGISEMMRGVASANADVTLDLMLMRTPEPDYEQLSRLARELGPRIRIRPPVEADDVVPALHEYDVGIFVLPPVNENYALALPNKFFDFIQARLGIMVGPSVEMARIVRDRELGVVTEDFTADALRTCIESLTPEKVDVYKAASAAAARDLASEAQVEIWAAAIERIVAVS